MTCEGCGAYVSDDVKKWYGTWLLCGGCKARSVTTGWLPSSANPADHQVLTEDRARLYAAVRSET
jgi:hypothetical protein